MIEDDTIEDDEIYPPYEVSAFEALTTAFSVLTQNEVSDNHRHMAAAYIKRMIDQKGCERFDPANKYGTLTTLIDIIVNG